MLTIEGVKGEEFSGLSGRYVIYCPVFCCCPVSAAKMALVQKAPFHSRSVLWAAELYLNPPRQNILLTGLFPQFYCWTLIWLSRHWAWLHRGYWRYRSLIDWLIDSSPPSPQWQFWTHNTPKIISLPCNPLPNNPASPWLKPRWYPLPLRQPGREPAV